MKHPLALALFLAVLGLASTAPAALSDFAIKDQITLAGKPGRLAVTPDDRFVLILDQTNLALDVLDTWDFSLKSDHIELHGTPVSITLNPTGSKAFITLTTGKVDVVDISKLSTLGFDQPLPSLTTPPSVTDSITVSSTAAALGDIATVPMSGTTSNSCVFVVDGDSLKWFKESDPATLADFGLSCLAREVEGGNKFAFVLCDSSPNAILQQIECTLTGPVDRTTPPNPLLGTNGDIQSLSLAPNSDWLVVGDSLTKTVTLIGADSVTAGTTIDAHSSSSQVMGMRDILATDFHSDSPVAFTVSGDTLTLAQIASSLDQFTDYQAIALPKIGGGFLAQGSTIDQYVFLALPGDTTLAVVTANPWVEITDASLKSGDTTGSGTLTISFTSDKDGTYVIKKATSFKVGTALTGGSGSLAAGETVTTTIKLTGLTEDQTIYAVEVTDSADRIGRDAVAVSTNLAPVGQNFSLGFGTRKLIITYSVQNRKNLDRQEIYYGTNCDLAVVPLDGYTLIDNNTVDQGRPTSPITISKPAAGKDIQKVVKGVRNETKYCVQIVTFDAAGRSSISVRKSIKVERAFTLTELTGEKGGFNCLGLVGSGQGFRGSGAWLAAVPGMALLLWRIRRRWRRGQ